MADCTWHYLQISDTLDRELAAALAEFVPVLAWKPKMHLLPVFAKDKTAHDEPLPASSRLRIRTFPMQKGFSRLPEFLQPVVAQQLLRRLLRQTENPRQTPLICSIPHFAPVAESWLGPVVYYLTDYIAGYRGANASLVHGLDARMCKAATLVCVNSRRLANYMIDRAGCPPEKVEVIPNATRAANLLEEPTFEPAALPSDAADLSRPVAGVIGNMSENIDWVLLSDVIDRSGEISWLFVGPTSMSIQDEAQRRARQRLMEGGGRIRFVGRKPYEELFRYARGLDFGIIPYSKATSTSYGSSTRLYDHLASCRPILTNRNVPVSPALEPFVHFFNTSAEAVTMIQQLHGRRFDDGAATSRWKRSQTETWQHRAFTIFRALERRTNQPSSGDDTDPSSLYRLSGALGKP